MNIHRSACRQTQSIGYHSANNTAKGGASIYPKSSPVRPLSCNWFYRAQFLAKPEAACALRYSSSQYNIIKSNPSIRIEALLLLLSINGTDNQTDRQRTDTRSLHKPVETSGQRKAASGVNASSRLGGRATECGGVWEGTEANCWSLVALNLKQ